MSNISRYTSITPVLKKLYWLPVEHRPVFKTGTLDNKFPHTGVPKYFSAYISSSSSSYSTWCSQSGGNFVISLQSSNPLFINRSDRFVIVLRLMPPLFGMLFLMTFMRPIPGLIRKAAQNLPVPQGIPT